MAYESDKEVLFPINITTLGHDTALVVELAVSAGKRFGVSFPHSNYACCLEGVLGVFVLDGSWVEALSQITSALDR